MLNNLLIYRLVIFNFLCGAGLAWAWQRGFVADMFLRDESHMTYVATILFFIGTFSLFWRSIKVGSALNRIKAGARLHVCAAKFTEKNAHLDDIGDLIVTAGLVGTAIGVVIMLHSFNPESLSDPSKVVETATMLGNGIGTAFRATIVSAIIWMVHIVNLRMLKTATVLMIEESK
ncbi:MAG: MotA/TolQ/ExbB proton channel family protein [Planctomycetota bacterium]|nr:MotA/TolQ/ExbB proton channel family protein [Planctomycetota bacterium]